MFSIFLYWKRNEVIRHDHTETAIVYNWLKLSDWNKFWHVVIYAGTYRIGVRYQIAHRFALTFGTNLIYSIISCLKILRLSQVLVERCAASIRLSNSALHKHMKVIIFDISLFPINVVRLNNKRSKYETFNPYVFFAVEVERPKHSCSIYGCECTAFLTNSLAAGGQNVPLLSTTWVSIRFYCPV